MKNSAGAFVQKSAQIYLCLLLLHHLFLFFMMGGIFHGDLMPWIHPGVYVFELLSAFLLLPFAMRKLPGAGFGDTSLGKVQLLSVTIFSTIVMLKSFNTNEDLVVNGILTAITPFIFLVMAPRIFEKKHYLILFWFICILAGIHSICQAGFVLGQTQVFCGFNVNMPHGRLIHVSHLPFLTRLDGYTGGWFTNPNCLASYIMAVPAISLFLSQRENTTRKSLRFLSLATFMLSLLSLFLTFSRAAILSTMLGLIPLAVLLLKRKRIPPVASFLGSLTIVLGLFLWQMRWTTLSSPFDLNGRQEIFKATWRSIKHMPFIGYGPFSGGGVIETPHNIYLANFLFYGIPGFLGLLAMIASAAWVAIIVVRRTPSTALLALSGFLAAYVFAYSQIEYVLTCPFSFSNSVAFLLIGFFVHLSLHNVPGPLLASLPAKQVEKLKPLGISLSSKFANALIVFAPVIIISSILYPAFNLKGKEYPVGSAERFTARVGRFLQSNQNPDLAVIGSSQMISFGLCCDWFYEGVNPPFDDFPTFLRYQSDYGRFQHLETLLKRRGVPVSQSVNLALPGGTMKDYRYLMDKMSDFGKQPKYLIIGVSPRDLGEPQSATSSRNQQVLSQFNVVNKNGSKKMYRLVRGFLRDLLNPKSESPAPSLQMKVTVPDVLQVFRHEIQLDMLQSSREQVSNLQAELASVIGAKKGMKEEIKEQILLRKNISNDIAFYKANYAIFKAEAFQERLSDLRYCLQKARQKNIVAFVVDMPLPKENLNLLSAPLLGIYRAGLSKVCLEEGVQLIGSSARAEHPLTDFYDCTHLNIRGGHLLSETIANAIADSKLSWNSCTSNNR